ncbi:MAG TPA: Tim44 domain-containing protein [Candidatus Bathyarchaeia archaeon]|nr:Tim44 domain-containing protein [Candidatus Bathyarchaeia archaeon]
MTRTRILTLALLLALVTTPVLAVTDAWARAGGGGSSGSRGSRSYSSPARPASTPTSPADPASPPAVQPQAPARPGWGGILGGLVIGGLLGGLLFGGAGGGIGLLEIAIIAGLAWMAVSYMRRQQQATPDYAPSGGGSLPAGARYEAGPAGGTTTMEVPSGPSDLARGLGHIRQMDPGFDPRAFAETASDVFFKIQGAWATRDMTLVASLLTPEMQDILQRDCDRLRAEQRINRLENVAVRSAEVTEAWQETGQDYVTVHFLASLLDYTTDESGGQVLEGSRTDPVKFEEYWTFTRPVGPGAFRLGAIQQP